MGKRKQKTETSGSGTILGSDMAITDLVIGHWLSSGIPVMSIDDIAQKLFITVDRVKEYKGPLGMTDNELVVTKPYLRQLLLSDDYAWVVK